ncbi:MAG: hypothetical protein JST64_13515 [Actinobacteria bacterium]|nr:hypothetical protein [Actinomycetota bacterium]
MSAVPSPDGSGAIRPIERAFPPVVQVSMVGLALAVVAGVLLASQVASDPSLVVPTAMVVAAVLLELVAVVMVVTIRPFAWTRFAQVFLWTFLAYVVQAGMIEFSFIRNDVPIAPLVVLTVGIVVFATIVPLMIAFTVARYQDPDD